MTAQGALQQKVGRRRGIARIADLNFWRRGKCKETNVSPEIQGGRTGARGAHHRRRKAARYPAPFSSSSSCPLR